METVCDNRIVIYDACTLLSLCLLLCNAVLLTGDIGLFGSIKMKTCQLVTFPMCKRMCNELCKKVLLPLCLNHLLLRLAIKDRAFFEYLHSPLYQCTSSETYFLLYGSGNTEMVNNRKHYHCSNKEIPLRFKKCCSTA